MKKITTALCLAGSMLVAAQAQAGWQGNWLLGVSAGYGDRDGDFDLSAGEIGAPELGLTTVRRNQSDSGFLWGVLGGYQVRCNGYVFGAEANLDWHRFDDAQSVSIVDPDGDSWAGSVRHERDTILGLVARAGYEVAPYFMPYVKLGAEYSKDELAYSLSVVGGTDSVAVTDDEGVWRFLGGLGFEVPIVQLMGASVRVEYNYSSKGKAVNAAANSTALTTSFNGGIKPDTHSGKVSFVWNFL